MSGQDHTHLEPWRGRAILHVDIDAFFAAVEQLDHPEWRGRAVIVGGSPEGRGVVSTASYEARRYGIRSAMAAARAAQLAPPDAVWATPRFERYKELSDAVFDVFRRFTPHVQPVSVDEAFVDVTPTASDSLHPVLIAQQISECVDELGITCSIGVSSGKTVSKIASDFDKPHGITVVWPGDEATFLAPLPIRDMSGIGPKTASRLRTHGIKTLGDLAALDDATAKELLGAHGPSAVLRARGVDERSVGERGGVKSVSNERTFAEDLRDPADIDGVVLALSDKVARRLRRKSLSGRTVNVKIRFSDFSTRSAQRTLAAPTCSEVEIGPIARALVRTLWSPGVGVRLVGVGVTGLDEPARQLGLFAEPGGATDGPCASESDTEKHERLIRGMDAIRERFGDSAIGRGSTKLRSPRTTGSLRTSYMRDEIDESEGGER